MADVYILLAGRTKLCVKLKNKGQICTVHCLEVGGGLLHPGEVFVDDF